MIINDNSYTPKVSIIIPVYNTEKYLRRCLASVCGQLLKEIEIICVNDGSTDNSIGILNDFAQRDNRIILIEKENGGPASARNMGLQIAKAPYIGFVDSDDIIVPDMYEKMYNALVENDVDFVECGVGPIFTYERDDTDRMREYYLPKHLSGKIEESDIFNLKSLIVCNKLFKKEKIKTYKIRFPDTFFFEDNLFLLAYKVFSKNGYYIPEILYVYYFYPGSTMGKAYKKEHDKRVLNDLDNIKLFLSFLQENDLFEKYKNVFWNYFTEQIDCFYAWASPDVIQLYGLKQIKELINIKEIYDLISERNNVYLKFNMLNDSELIELSFLDKNISIKIPGSSTRRINVRKLIKYILPYGIVCGIQKIKKQRAQRENLKN
jgi:glycosyltransferase involved in cell wall biosynthesis